MDGKGRLTGKVALVTGAAQGIGAAYARALAGEGAFIALCDLKDPHLVADEIAAAGGVAMARALDVTDGAAVRRFVGDIERERGPVDILVNNAAIFGGIERKKFVDIDAAEWDRVMTVNTRSVLECAKAVVPGMSRRKSGKIINIASATVHAGAPLFLHYVASKGAVIAMTRAMARELGDDGIAVNCLAPGLTMSEAVLRDMDDATIAASAGRRCFKRRQQPEDLLGPLIFLSSSESDFVTGQTFLVDGGQMMQ
ncbi:MAG TPA: SDR family oxidoreductase [Hyphomicrobiales bacterium]|nr:SDR family oxidoreductase [Hyphomicrobiales bacterium]